LIVVGSWWRMENGVYALSWSSLEHLSAIQQDISAIKDLVVQMHSTSIPHFEGIASVAQLRWFDYGC